MSNVLTPVNGGFSTCEKSHSTFFERASASVLHTHDRSRIERRKFHRSVQVARSRAADHHGHAHAGAFERDNRVRHFVERRRNQTAQAHDIRIFRGFGDCLGRDHHAQIRNRKAVAAEHHGDYVFADVVHVALDRSQEHFGRAG